jgi:hypothetical protein
MHCRRLATKKKIPSICRPVGSGDLDMTQFAVFVG